MKNKQRMITALVTIVAATATAHLMQRNGAQAAWMQTATPGVQTASVVPVSPARRPEPMPDPLAAAPVEAAAMPNIPEVENALPVTAIEPAPVGPQPAPVVLAAVSGADAPVTGQTPTIAPDAPRLPVDAVAPQPLPQTGAGLAERMAATAQGEAPAPEVSARPKRNALGLTCGVILSAAEKPGGMVNLMLTAPCRGEEVITVSHGDLTFSGKLSHLGSFTALIPALDEAAEFTVDFTDGESAQTQLAVPAATAIERVVLQTKGETGLQIHALEFGADYDTPGHVWAGQPRDAAQAIRSGGGFITQLGDPALPDARMAEVYTFPADARTRDGVVRLSIEAEVTAYNCSKDISGQTMQQRAGGGMKAVTVSVAMPDCDAIGEFLVLKNLLQDLKIASN